MNWIKKQYLIKDQPQRVEWFREEWRAEYERELDVLWNELVRLNSYMFILKKMTAFRFDLFLPSSYGTSSWSLICNGLLEVSIMIIWKIGFDDHKKTLTLPRLLEQMRTNMIPDRLTEFDNAIKPVNFQGEISEIEGRLNRLRHNFLAHFNLKINISKSPERMKQYLIYFEDMKRLTDSLNQLFKRLCLEEGRAVVPADYYPSEYAENGTARNSDIEEMSDRIAKGSELLNMPEEQPQFWPHYRNNLTLEDLEVLNHYRQKFGLKGV